MMLLISYGLYHYKKYPKFWINVAFKSMIKYFYLAKLTQIIDSLHFQGGTLIAITKSKGSSGGTELCIG
jgi:hypothetical protein